jgi:acyl-CoA thioester hydrolase
MEMEMQVEQTLVKEPESTAIVRFQDCDPFGHLNNARYIDYFINARQDHLAKYYSFRLFDNGAAENWVVTKNQIAYLRPARLMEEVLIRTRLIHMGEDTLVVEAQMLDARGQRLKAVGWAEFAYITLATGRKAKHSNELMQFFANVVVDEGIYPAGFDQRVDSLKKPISNN